MNPLLRLALIAPLLFAAVPQEAVSPTDSLHVGCVMKTEGGDFTLCEGNLCSFVTGKDVTSKLAGHSVTLRGKVHESTAEVARTIVVTQIVSVGAPCHETCSPRPPGHRGFGKKDKPGSEGGTPGVTTQPKP